MAKSATFAVLMFLLLTVTFAARPLVNEVAEGAPAPSPLFWGPVYEPFEGLDDLFDDYYGPDASAPYWIEPAPILVLDMAKFASFGVLMFLLLTVTFTAQPIADEVAGGSPAPSPLFWGPDGEISSNSSLRNLHHGSPCQHHGAKSFIAPDNT